MIHKYFALFPAGFLIAEAVLHVVALDPVRMPHQLLVMAQSELCLPFQSVPQAAPLPAGPYKQGSYGIIPPLNCSLND